MNLSLVISVLFRSLVVIVIQRQYFDLLTYFVQILVESRRFLIDRFNRTPISRVERRDIRLSPCEKHVVINCIRSSNVGDG